MGISRTNIHAISAYRQILQHARVQKSELVPVCEEEFFQETPKASSPVPFVASPLATPSKQPRRLDEWLLDSETLLADAFLVDRLSRIYFGAWKKYIHRCEMVSEALFVRDRDSCTKMCVKVFLALTHSVQLGTRFRLLTVLIKRKMDFNLKRNMMNRMIMRKRQKIEFFEKLKMYRQNLCLKMISNWFSKSNKIVETRIYNLKRFRLLSYIFTKLGKAQQISYLSKIEKYREMNEYKMRCVFKKFRQNILQRDKYRIATTFHHGNLRRKTFHSLICLPQKRFELISHFFSNPISAYLLYKWTPSSVGVHSNRIHQLRALVSRSIMVAGVQVWRKYVQSRKRLADIAETKFAFIQERNKNEMFQAWRKWQERETNISVGLFFLQKNEKFKNNLNCIHFWNLWKVRLRNRIKFKRQLSAHVNDKIGRQVGKIMQGWKNRIFERKNLEKIRVFYRLNLKKSVFKSMRNAQLGKEIEEAKEEIARLHYGKKIGKRFFEIFQYALIRGKEWQELKKMGIFLQKKIWINRWQSSIRMEERVKEMQRGIEVRQLRRIWINWLQIWFIVCGEKNRDFLQKKMCFSILFANKTAQIQKAQDAILVRFCLEKQVFRRLKQRVEFGKRSVEIFAKIALKKWIQRVYISKVFQNLNHQCSKFVLKDSFLILIEFSKSKRANDICQIERIVFSKIRNILAQWRLLYMFKKASLFRKDFSDVSNQFRKWIQLTLVMKMERKHDSKTKRILLNKWCLPRRMNREKNAKQIRIFFNLFRSAYINRLHVDLQLIAQVEQVKQVRVVSIMREWQMIVEQRRRVRFNVLSGWIIIVKERMKFEAIWRKNREKQFFEIFNFWKNRFVLRQMLKQRLIDLHQHSIHRLIVNGFVGFARNIDEKRKFQKINTGTKISNFLDKWISATVTIIAVRDCTNRIIIIRNKVCLRHGFERLREKNRFDKFAEKIRIKQSNFDSHSYMKQCIIEWNQMAQQKIKIRDKLHIVWKSDFFGKLKEYLFNEKTKFRAAQFSLFHQADRLESVVSDVLFGWRDVTEYEQVMRKKIRNLSQFMLRKLASNTLQLWRTLLDIQTYKSGVAETEFALVDRKELRDMSLYFNKWIREYQEYQFRLNDCRDIREKILKNRVFKGFFQKKNLTKKASLIRHKYDLNLIRFCLSHIKHRVSREVRAEKEERKMRLKRVFSGFKKLIFRRKNLDHIQVVFLGQREDQRADDLKRIIIDAWKLFLYTNRLETILPYQQQRTKIVSGNSTPELTHLSYRNRRSSPVLTPPILPV